MVGFFFLAFGILAVVVLGVGFFKKIRPLMFFGWLAVLGTVASGVAGI